MTATVTATVAEKRDVLVVPNAALRFRPEARKSPPSCQPLKPVRRRDSGNGAILYKVEGAELSRCGFGWHDGWSVHRSDRRRTGRRRPDRGGGTTAGGLATDADISILGAAGEKGEILMASIMEITAHLVIGSSTFTRSTMRRCECACVARRVARNRRVDLLPSWAHRDRASRP